MCCVPSTFPIFAPIHQLQPLISFSNEMKNCSYNNWDENELLLFCYVRLLRLIRGVQQEVVIDNDPIMPFVLMIYVFCFLSFFVCDFRNSEEIECSEPIEVVSYKIGVCKVSKDGKECRTVFKKLSSNGKTSVVLARPRTGRMHQIRVHLQYLGKLSPRYFKLKVCMCLMAMKRF